MSGHGSLVLGVETSCDDTAVALVDVHGSVIASCVASQTALHNTSGGVYPELASRAHIDKILPTVQAVLAKDVPAVQAGTLVIGIGFVLVNLLVDLLYTVLDPRLRGS